MLQRCITKSYFPFEKFLTVSLVASYKLIVQMSMEKIGAFLAAIDLNLTIKYVGIPVFHCLMFPVFNRHIVT
jgi:hypothetical protein